MTISYLEIYDTIFSKKASPHNWEDFSNDISTSLSSHEADFSMTSMSPPEKTTKKISAFFLKVIFLPLGFYVLLRYFIQRLLMSALYPSQSRIARLSNPMLNIKNLDQTRKKSTRTLQESGYIVRNVILDKDGTRFHGIMIGHPSIIFNGKWVLQAIGNRRAIENSMEHYAKTYINHGYNVQLINGPSVGRSEGEATPESMGDAQELGISFLENAIKAEQIVLAGKSLGGAAISKAIQNHQFRNHIRYLIVRQATFDRVSNIMGHILMNIVPFLKKFAKHMMKKIVIWSRCEIDSVEASKLLSKKGIPEFIVQAGKLDCCFCTNINQIVITTDGLIPQKASLAYGVLKKGMPYKYFYVGNFGHDDLRIILDPVKHFDNLLSVCPLSSR